MTAQNLFYGTRGPRDADIMMVGESWGSNEAEKKLPFVGRTGDELERIAQEAGIDLSSVFLTNVVSAKPSGNNMPLFFYKTDDAKTQGVPSFGGLYPHSNVREGIELLRQQIKVVRPKVIVGFGNYTLWALTDDSYDVANDKDFPGRKVPRGVGKWRGSQLYTREDMGNVPFMPTYHPAAIFNQWPWRYLIRHDLQMRMPKALEGNWAPPDYKFGVRPSFETAMRWLYDWITRLDKSPCSFAVDLETRNHMISCCGIGRSNLDAFCIPFQCVERDDGYWTAEEEAAIILLFRRILGHPNARIIGSNFLYDMQYIWREWGVIAKPWIDTQLYQHLCWPGTLKGLAYVCSLYNNYYRFWKEDSKEWLKGMPEDTHWAYNCRDCVSSFESGHHLLELVKKLGLEKQAGWQMRQIPMVFNMMRRGVNIDTKAKARIRFELGETFSEIGARLEDVLPESVYPRKPKASPWYTSPTQQAEIFYDVLGIKAVRGGKSGRTVDDAALETIMKREPVLTPILKSLQDLRSLRVYKTHFADAKLDADSRMRSQYDPSGTKTFRWNSSKDAYGGGGNLQNVPVGREADDG